MICQRFSDGSSALLLHLVDVEMHWNEEMFQYQSAGANFRIRW